MSTGRMPPPPVPGAAWSFSKHAIRRALDMCIDGAQIAEVLADPVEVWVSPKYPDCEMRSDHRIIVAVDPGTLAVITIMWYLRPGEPRFQRTLTEDLSRIRET